MTFIPNQIRKERQFAEYDPPAKFLNEVNPTGIYRRASVMVHVLKCDTCGLECTNDPLDDYITYVPDAWHVTNRVDSWKRVDSEKHKCPDCKSFEDTGHLIGCLESTKGEHDCTCRNWQQRIDNHVSVSNNPRAD